MANNQIKLAVFAQDPLFRLGLVTACQNYSDIEIIAEGTPQDREEIFTTLDEQVPLIVLLVYEQKLDLESFTEQIRQDYPRWSLFLLLSQPDTSSLAAARTAEVEGYCFKGVSVDNLVLGLREVAAGKVYWQEIDPNLIRPSTGEVLPSPLPEPRKPPSWLTKLRYSSLEQIEVNLQQIQIQLKQPQLRRWEVIYWRGRRRELLAAQWLVNQILPIETVVISVQQNNTSPSSQLPSGESSGFLAPSLSQPPVSLSQTFSTVAKNQLLFENTLTKIKSGVKNATSSPLEIDILQGSRKRELLYIALQQLAKSLEELNFLQITAEQLPEKRTSLLRDLWQSSTIEFFSKYYSPPAQTADYQIVDMLLKDVENFQEASEDKFPFVLDLLAYLLHEKPLQIDKVPYSYGTPEAQARAEMILQNLLIQIANGVMQVLLNRFSDVEKVKQALFASNFLPSREVARFRNSLSWRYRQEYYVKQPKSVFESRYRLYYLDSTTLRKTHIYAPRQEDLRRLTGIPWLVTIILEARDAVAPLVQSVVSWLGSSVVYLLTQVIGRGLGLIGRGIIQGVGNSLQDTRYGKNNEQGEK